MSDSFTLDDFRDYIQSLVRPTFLQRMTTMFAGRSSADDAEIDRFFSIIDTMSPEERANSKIIDQGRIHRIATKVGCELHEVTDLIKEYQSIAEFMARRAGKSTNELIKELKEIQKSTPTYQSCFADKSCQSGRRDDQLPSDTTG